MVRWRVIYDLEVTNMTLAFSGFDCETQKITEMTCVIDNQRTHGPLHEYRDDAVKEMNNYNAQRCGCCDPQSRLQTVLIDEPALRF